MLPRDNRPSALPSGLLDSPPRSFVRGEMASDGDITRPHNPIPRLEIPPGSASQWHVHLELRPEQLVALHRMGFTSGALAWRQGMDRWQPLRDGSESEVLASGEEASGDADEHETSGTKELGADNQPASGSQLESKRHFAFPRAPVGLVQATPVSSRPPPSHEDQVLDEMLGRPLPPPPRMPSAIPPRLSEEASYEPAFDADFDDADTGFHSPAPLALVPKPGWLARTQHTPTSLERPASIPPLSIPPPAILDTYGGHRAMLPLRTLWFGMGATVLVSAAVAALVSSLVWTLHARFSEPEPISDKVSAAGIETAKPEPKRAAVESAAEPLPTSVSVDQLPLLSGTRTAAPVTITSEPSRTAPPRTEPHAARDAEEPVTPSHSRATPKPAPAAPPAVKEAPSALEQSIAARLVENTESKPAQPEEAPPPAEPAGPLDRGAVARAVAQAAASATSCGSSPESGQVMVKFAPSGSAQAIQLLKPFSSRDVNACVLRAMSRARVTPFTGEPVSVRKTIRW